MRLIRIIQRTAYENITLFSVLDSLGTWPTHGKCSQLFFTMYVIKGFVWRACRSCKEKKRRNYNEIPLTLITLVADSQPEHLWIFHLSVIRWSALRLPILGKMSPSVTYQSFSITNFHSKTERPGNLPPKYQRDSMTNNLKFNLFWARKTFAQCHYNNYEKRFCIFYYSFSRLRIALSTHFY